MGILAQKQKRGSSAGHRMLVARVRRGRGCEGRWRVVGVRGRGCWLRVFGPGRDRAHGLRRCERSPISNLDWSLTLGVGEDVDSKCAGAKSGWRHRLRLRPAVAERTNKALIIEDK